MYNIVIVDDEPAIREGLKTLIDWRSHGFQVAGSAASGREALVLHTLIAPHLMVVDIRMPGMTGIDLIREIRQADNRCHFIILSGHADFGYAQQAIAWGVNAYILKPVDEEELDRELTRVAALLADEPPVVVDFFAGEDIPPTEDNSPHETRSADLVEGAIPLTDLGDRLFFALDLGSKEKARETIAEAGELLVCHTPTEEYVKSAFARILTIALNKLSARSHEHNNLAQEYLLRISEIYEQHSFQTMLEHIREMTDQMAERLGNESNLPAIRQILYFIEQHYGENLKLETLAELFNYSSGYLGRLIKTHTGDNFNTLLDHIRISRSIELLGNGMKVHQVAACVGYANVDYFHAKFKKYTGTTPSSYKAKPGKPPDTTVEQRL